MRKKIKTTIGSLLALSILLLVPAVSAVEYNNVAKTLEKKVFEKIGNVKNSQLKEKVKCFIKDRRFIKNDVIRGYLIIFAAFILEFALIFYFANN